MLDIERQLQSYFEETVERVTAEDVTARVNTARGVRLPERRIRLRPLAAGAVGFGLAMSLVGIVSVTVRLFGAEIDDATNGPAGTSSTGGTLGTWAVVAMVVGLAVLVAGLVLMRRTQQGGEDMQTMEQVDQETLPIDDATHRLQRRYRFFVWLSGLLAIAVLAMGAWMMFGDDDGQSLTANQEQMLETIANYEAAWNAGDGAAVAALMAPGGYHDNGGEQIPVTDGRLEAYVRTVHGMGFSVRSTDSYVVGQYVLTRSFVPEDATFERPSIVKMTPDGTKIEWHLAP